MFDRRQSDEIAAAQEIVAAAVNQARVPGATQSRGNAAGGVTSIQTDVSGQPSGTDADGNSFFPFLLDVDALDASGPRLG